MSKVLDYVRNISLKESLKACISRTGLLYAMCSCFFFATSSVLVHVLDELHPVQTVFFRSFIQLLFTAPMLIYHGVNPLPSGDNLQETGILIFRGVACSTALCFQFSSLQNMPLSDATVIIFSSPIFTGIFAYCFLSETWSKLDAVAAVLCLLGVVMIAQPGDFFTENFKSNLHLGYCIVALLGAVLTSLSIIALKKLRVHYVISSFYLALIGAFGTGILCLIPGVFRPVICGHQIFVVLIGLCAVGGQCLLCKSLSMEKASTVALIRTFDIVLAFIFQLIFFDHQPNIYSVSGAILVSMCNIVILGATKYPLDTKDVHSLHPYPSPNSLSEKPVDD